MCLWCAPLSGALGRPREEGVHAAGGGGLHARLDVGIGAQQRRDARGAPRPLGFRAPGREQQGSGPGRPPQRVEGPGETGRRELPLWPGDSCGPGCSNASIVTPSARTHHRGGPEGPPLRMFAVHLGTGAAFTTGGRPIGFGRPQRRLQGGPRRPQRPSSHGPRHRGHLLQALRLGAQQAHEQVGGALLAPLHRSRRAHGLQKRDLLGREVHRHRVRPAPAASRSARRTATP
jgi:hypothetical protein